MADEQVPDPRTAAGRAELRRLCVLSRSRSVLNEEESFALWKAWDALPALLDAAEENARRPPEGRCPVPETPWVEPLRAGVNAIILDAHGDMIGEAASPGTCADDERIAAELVRRANAEPGLRAEVARLRALLRHAEWRGHLGACPYCGCGVPLGGAPRMHAPGCELAAALAGEG